MAAQTVYNVLPGAGFPGMLYDNATVQDPVTGLAGEVIPPGRLCEFNASTGALQLVQGGATLRPAGISQWIPNVVGGTYPIGAPVSCIRKGRVWVEFSGGTKVPGAAINVKNSTTLAADRGKFSFTATSTTTGAEITAAPSTILSQFDNGSTTVAVVEINIP